MTLKEEFENLFGYQLHNPALGFGVSAHIVKWVESKVEVARIESVAYKGKLKREAYQRGYEDGLNKYIKIQGLKIAVAEANGRGET